MEKVQKIYNNLWKESIEKFKDNKFQSYNYLNNHFSNYMMSSRIEFYWIEICLKDDLGWTLILY